jgi:hypothetical protein
MSQQAYVLCLVLSYVALGTLYLMLLSRLRLARPIKAAAIVAMTVLYVASFYWAEGLLGWSAAIAVPERFKVLSTRVIEPNLARNRPGAVHLWVEELDERNIPSGEPRAFRLPYSVELASKVATVQDEINKGRPQGGTRHAFNRGVGGGAPQGTNVRTVTQGAAFGGDPSGGGVLDPSALGGQSRSVNLIPLPPPLLPPKDNP